MNIVFHSVLGFSLSGLLGMGWLPMRNANSWASQTAESESGGRI